MKRIVIEDINQDCFIIPLKRIDLIVDEKDGDGCCIQLNGGEEIVTNLPFDLINDLIDEANKC